VDDRSLAATISDGTRPRPLALPWFFGSGPRQGRESRARRCRCLRAFARRIPAPTRPQSPEPKHHDGCRWSRALRSGVDPSDRRAVRSHPVAGRSRTDGSHHVRWNPFASIAGPGEAPAQADRQQEGRCARHRDGDRPRGGCIDTRNVAGQNAATPAVESTVAPGTASQPHTPRPPNGREDIAGGEPRRQLQLSRRSGGEGVLTTPRLS